MNHGRKTLFLLMAVFITLVITVIGALQEKSAKPEQAKIKTADFSQFPTVDLSNPVADSTEPKTNAKKAAKQRRYNKKQIVSNIPGKGTVHFGNDWDAGLTGIPANQSDAVVVGKILGSAAYLSEDKGAVYSDFTVQVDEVIKNNSNTPLLPGSSITADRLGGVVKYGHDLSRLYRVVGQDLPRVGRCYVLFLKSTGEESDYSITLGYELRENKVFLLDEIPVTAPYAGVDASTFLKVVKDDMKATAQLMTGASCPR